MQIDKQLPIKGLALLLVFGACFTFSTCENTEKKERALLEMKLLGAEHSRFSQRFGDLPSTASELWPPKCEPRDSCFLTKEPVDPWGTPYRAITTGRRLTVESAGQDRTWQSEDDILLTLDISSN